jgi:hypothetical protein
MQFRVIFLWCIVRASLEKVLVCAGAPKLQVAFGHILSDPYIQLQKNNVEVYLKKQKLKEKEKEADEKRKYWLEELDRYPHLFFVYYSARLFDSNWRNARRTNQMIEHADQWKEQLDPAVFTNRMAASFLTEQQILDSIKTIEDDITKIRKDLDSCK